MMASKTIYKNEDEKPEPVKKKNLDKHGHRLSYRDQLKRSWCASI